MAKLTLRSGQAIRSAGTVLAAGGWNGDRTGSEHGESRVRDIVIGTQINTERLRAHHVRTKRDSNPMNFVDFFIALVGRVGLADYGLLALIWGMTLLGALYTFFTHDYHREPKTLRGFVRFCVPMWIVTARQTRLDLFYAMAMKVLRALWRWAFLSNLAIAYVVYAGLSLLGPESWNIIPLHAPSPLE
jgi:hypothetical protein